MTKPSIYLAAVSGLFGLSALTTPLAAQTALCGGLAEGAAWMAAGEAASDIATAGAPLVWDGAVAADGRAVAMFSLSAPMPIRVEAAATDASGDPLLELYDASGRIVVFDDDAGGGGAARAEPDLAPGLYCLAMAGFAGTPLVGRMQVSRLEMAAMTPGLAGGFAGTEAQAPFVGIDPCTADTAADRLGGGGAIDTALAAGLEAELVPDEMAYLRFQLDQPTALRIRAENEDADPYLYVFDGAGALLAENDDFDSLNSQVAFDTPLPAGSYCIGVRALWDPSLPIRVSLDHPGASPDTTADGAAGYSSDDIAPPLDGSWPVVDLGVLPPEIGLEWPVPGDSTQWFVVTVPDSGLLWITADALDDSDPVLVIFDETGGFLGRNDDAFDTLNAALAMPTVPGRYIVGLSQFDEFATGRIRLTFARYVPAGQ